MASAEYYIMEQEMLEEKYKEEIMAYNNKNLMQRANQIGEAQAVTAELRTESFNETGEYLSDEEILKRSKRGNGGATSYYELPKGATELRHLIRHKNMSHPIGEAFCALYRLNDNDEYKRNLEKAKFYIECELEYLK